MIKSKSAKTLTQVKPSGVWLVSLVPAIIKVRGTVTGKDYTFEGAGSTVYVDEQDVDGILAHSRTPCDCSSKRGVQPYFEILEV